MRNARNRCFKHCGHTELSSVLACVFREVRDFIEVWIVHEHRVIVHNSDLVELVGLITCVEGGLGQTAKLLAARAEMRMPCAFRTGKYGKNVWMSKSGMVSKWQSRNSKDGWDTRLEKARFWDMTHVQRPFYRHLSHACVDTMRSVRSTQWACCAQKNVRATSECMHTGNNSPARDRQ